MLLSQYFYNCWDLNSLLIKKKKKKKRKSEVHKHFHIDFTTNPKCQATIDV